MAPVSKVRKVAASLITVGVVFISCGGSTVGRGTGPGPWPLQVSMSTASSNWCISLPPKPVNGIRKVRKETENPQVISDLESYIVMSVSFSVQFLMVMTLSHLLLHSGNRILEKLLRSLQP